LIVAVPGGLWLYGLAGCFIAMGLATFGLCIAAWPVMSKALAARGISITYSGALSEWPLITRFAVPALLASLLFEPVNWICTAIIVSTPNGLAEVGG
jgi:hypothetical protein